MASDGTPVDHYLGVPYGAPPVGQSRFTVSQPFGPWEEERDATMYKNFCYMALGLASGLPRVNYSEDCLYLNVFTPHQSADQSEHLYPVMIWIHGGAYVGGSSAGAGDVYNPSELVKKGIIAVTVNYRLDIFGFLSTADDAARGNWGLWDQNLAIKWVFDNIRYFGGDKADITIQGESAGAGSVSLQLLSPYSYGLFRKVIAESGSCLGEWSIITDPMKYARRVGTELGCAESTTDELIQCIRDVEDPMEILQNVGDISDIMIPWAPVVDGTHGFIPKHPRDLLQAGEYDTSVRYLTGVNRDEGWIIIYLLFYNPSGMTHEHLINSFIPYILTKADRQENNDILYASIAQEYGCWENTSEVSLAERKANDIITDWFFVSAVDEELMWHTTNGMVAYRYGFHYEVDGLFKDGYVLHAAEIPYVFGVPLRMDNYSQLCSGSPLPCIGPTSDEDRDISKKMIQMWTDFIKSGDPTPSEPPNSKQKWLPYTPADGNYLLIENRKTPIGSFVEGRTMYKTRAASFWSKYLHPYLYPFHYDDTDKKVPREVGIVAPNTHDSHMITYDIVTEEYIPGETWVLTGAAALGFFTTCLMTVVIMKL